LPTIRAPPDLASLLLQLARAAAMLFFFFAIGLILHA
jgi:hypothetical protein